MSLRVSLFAVLVVGLVLSCGGPGTPKDGRPSASAAPVASSGAGEAAPAVLDDLASLVPKEAKMVAHFPAEFVSSVLAPAIPEGLRTEMAPGVWELTASFDGAVAFREDASTSPTRDLLARGASGWVVRFRDDTALDKLAAALSAEAVGADRWTSPRVELAALRSDRVMLIASDRRLCDRMVALRDGGESFKNVFLYRRGAEEAHQRDPQAVWAVADLSSLLVGDTTFGAGSFVFASLSKDRGLEVRFTQQGHAALRAGQVFDKSDPELFLELPQGPSRVPLAYWNLGLGRPKSKSVRDWVTMLNGPGKDDAITLAELLMEGTTTFAELDNMLGDELAVAVYPSREAAPDLSEAIAMSSVLGFVRLRDESVAKKLLEKIAGGLGSTTTYASGTLAHASPSGARLVVAVETGRLVFRYGQPRDLQALAREQGKVGDQADARALAQRAKGSHHALMLDFSVLVGALPTSNVLPGVTMPADARAYLSMTYAPSETGLDLSMRATASPGMGAGLGVMTALTVHGVRQYLATAKIAEAKNTIGAIARGAQQAYERESADDAEVAHRLCESAVAVPASVPSARRYQPSGVDGVDFQLGDQVHGWKCLKFSMSTPHYYQYDYRRGGPYKGPARGGPDPGKDGFEASAEGDLDGDGKTSLFTLTGKLDPKRGVVVIRSDVFVSDEFE